MDSKIGLFCLVVFASPCGKRPRQPSPRPSPSGEGESSAASMQTDVSSDRTGSDPSQSSAWPQPIKGVGWVKNSPIRGEILTGTILSGLWNCPCDRPSLDEKSGKREGGKRKPQSRQERHNRCAPTPGSWFNSFGMAPQGGAWRGDGWNHPSHMG